MYIVKINKEVNKFLKKHQKQKVVDLFYKAIKELEIDPTPNNSKLDIEILKGLKRRLFGLKIFRLKIGGYRFIYEIKKYEVII